MNSCSDCGHSTFFDWTGYTCPKCGRFPESIVRAYQESADRIPTDIHEQIRAQMAADGIEEKAQGTGDQTGPTSASEARSAPEPQEAVLGAGPRIRAAPKIRWGKESEENAERLAETLDGAGGVINGAGIGAAILSGLAGLLAAGTVGDFAGLVMLVIGLAAATIVYLVAHALATLLAGLGAIVRAQSATASATLELLRLERRRGIDEHGG